MPSLGETDLLSWFSERQSLNVGYLFSLFYYLSPLGEGRGPSYEKKNLNSHRRGMFCAKSGC